jgi:1,4-dihydroxy-2-naphthoyl-CoA hydrolase
MSKKYHQPDLTFLNDLNKNTLGESIGIEFIEIGENFLKAKMPVDQRTHQPMGLLHGGASVALAETLGSVSSTFYVEDPFKTPVVGVEINANHIKAKRNGFVIGTCTPLKIGRTLHIWQIDIHDENQELICTCRFTSMVVSQEKK